MLMKKLLLSLPLLGLLIIGFGSCTQQRKWDHEQRKAMHEALKAYRKMVYLNDLTDPEFTVFSDSVTVDLEAAYPVYAEFIEMQGVDDTIDMVVVTTIVEQLKADAHNMRHIFPYNTLVAQGVLPSGLDLGQQRAFYKCLAGKVNTTFWSIDQFFQAVWADTTDMSQIRQLESQCANDLFSWVVEEVDVDVIEPVPAATN